MAECHYSPSQAHEFLFAQGWDKYHDRFFTRCYVQEGEAAYDKAVETKARRSVVKQLMAVAFLEFTATRIADSNSRNAVSFSSARATKGKSER